MSPTDKQNARAGFYWMSGAALASIFAGAAWALGNAVLALAWDKLIGR